MILTILNSGVTQMTAFNEGYTAHSKGLPFDAFPDEYLERVTKLGTRVGNDKGAEWQNGWISFTRTASRQEVNDAEQMDISKFRRKSNRYYK